MLEEKKGNKRDKISLRHFFRQKRREFCAEHFSSKSPSSHLFKKNLIRFTSCLLPPKTDLCAIYWPLSDEFNPLPLRSHFSLLKWAFPRIEKKDLIFYIPSSLSSFKENAFGLMEPDPCVSEKIPLSSCQVVFVPALAYDRRCGRLGRGNGYYDRALKDYKGLKVGLAYSIQVDQQNLPMNEKMGQGFLDVRVDAVVTEKFFFQNWKSKEEK